MSQTTNFLCTLTCQYLLLVLMSLNILLNLQMMLQLWKKTINLKISKNSIVIQIYTYLINWCENIYTSFVGIFSRTPHPSRYSNKASYSSLNGLALQNPHCPGVPSVGGGGVCIFSETAHLGTTHVHYTRPESGCFHAQVDWVGSPLEPSALHMKIYMAFLKPYTCTYEICHSLSRKAKPAHFINQTHCGCIGQPS